MNLFNTIKSLFQDRCPDCSESLLVETDAFRCVKSCPHHHYKEEIYAHLDVRIVYNDVHENVIR